MVVPIAPKIVSLARVGNDLQLVWQGMGGSSYAVQAAGALGGANPFTDVSGVLTLSGSGTVTTTYIAPAAFSTYTTRFYRIRTN